MSKSMPAYAGLREWRKSRDTGYYVGLYDGVEAGMNTAAGRWQTVCEEHGSVCSHLTYALARSFMAAPLVWCELCQGEQEGRA